MNKEKGNNKIVTPLKPRPGLLVTFSFTFKLIRFIRIVSSEITLTFLQRSYVK